MVVAVLCVWNMKSEKKLNNNKYWNALSNSESVNARTFTIRNTESTISISIDEENFVESFYYSTHTHTHNIYTKKRSWKQMT